MSLPGQPSPQGQDSVVFAIPFNWKFAYLFAV